MTTMNVSLPATLKAYVDDQVAARGYGSASEYVRDLIRRDADIQKFRALIQEGLDSGPAEAIDEAYFDELRAVARGA